MTPLIRPERPGDEAAISSVICAAFSAAAGGPAESVAEARLVTRMRSAGDLALSLVAQIDGAVIGHAGFFPIRVLPDRRMRIWGLGPLAVMPDRQRQGTGKALCRAGIESARRAGVDFMLVLGDPDYYGRFGFRADWAATIDVPWPGPHYMGLPLSTRAGAMPLRGRADYPAAFAQLGA
jgi:predicted N-acetyltransferase YhbS